MLTKIGAKLNKNNECGLNWISNIDSNTWHIVGLTRGHLKNI